MLYKRGVLKTSYNSQINKRISHPEVFYQKIFLKMLQNSQKNIFTEVSFLIKLQTGNMKLKESWNWRCSLKKVFLKILKISPEKNCVWISSESVLRVSNFIKENSDTVVYLWNLWIIQEKDLQMVGSRKPARGSLFNKVGNLTSWRPSAVLERDSGTGISLWILWNFYESFFAELLLATTSHIMLFYPFYRSLRVAA